MQTNDWKTVFPEVPESFHNAVRGALERAARQARRKKGKRLIALAAAAAALLVSAAAVATWHGKVAERFEAGPEAQKALSEQGAVGLVNQSVSQNGLTVTALQTLGDKNGLYILFHIRAPEGISLSEDDSAIGLDVSVDGADRLSWSASFLPDAEKPAGAENEHYFELWLDNTRGQDLLGREITVRFSDLRDMSRGPEENVVVPGAWELSWPIAYMDQMRTFDLNAVYTVAGQSVVVRSVDISPLSMTLRLEGEGLETLAARSDLNEAGGLCAVTLVGRDEERFPEGPKNEFISGGVYTQIIRFSRVYDLTGISGFELTFYHEPDDNTIPVPLALT